MSEEAAVLKAVCRKLGVAGIPYMITGSIAANFYAVPRMTRDIDIVIEIRKQDVDHMADLFKKDFYIDKESISEAIDTHGMFNILHNEYVIKIDFIVRKESAYRKLEFERRREVVFEGQKISIVSPEDLILSKLFWAKDSLSETQLGDVKNLMRMVKGIDMSYIDTWVRSLNLQEIYRRVKP